MIDLLPASAKNAIRKEYKLRVFTVCLAMLSLVLMALVFSFLPTYLFTLSRYGAFLAESQSDETQSRISQVKEMETTVLDTNKKIDLLRSGASAPHVKDIFLEILESKTIGVAITGLSYDAGGAVSKRGKEETITSPTIGIQGRSSDRAELLAFKGALAQKKEFGLVDLPIASLVKDTDLSFSINISMLPQKTK
jgi:hypothetical protein